MQAKNEIPFLFGSEERPSNFLSRRKNDSYLWREGDASVAIDCTDFLLEVYNKHYNKKTSAGLPAPDLPDHIKCLERKKISLDLRRLAAFDKPGAGYFNENIDIILKNYRIVLEWLSNQNEVGFNFQAVFYVPDGQQPPAHYRAGIDICVNNPEEYKKHVDSPTYQFAMFCFKQFKPNPDSVNEADLLVASYLQAEDSGQEVLFSQKKPIKDYQFHNSALSFPCSNLIEILPIRNPVQPSDLEPYLRRFFPKGELLLLIYGEEYADESKRQAWCDVTYDIVARMQTPLRLRIVFITTRHSNLTLPQLLAGIEKSDTDRPYYALPAKVGFYYPSPDVLNLFYSRIDEASSIQLLKLKKVENLQKQQRGYRVFEASGKETRASKSWNRSQIKDNARLVINQKTNLAENQIQTHQTQETQQTQAASELEFSQQFEEKHKLISTNAWNWSPSYYLHSYDFNAFCKFLQNVARQQLKESILEEELATQGFLTQFYLKHFSKKIHLEKLVEDKDFLAEEVAKVFGKVLVKDPAGSGKLLLSLAEYSMDKVYVSTELGPLNFCARRLFFARDGLFLKEENGFFAKVWEDAWLGRVLIDTVNRREVAVSISWPLLFSKLNDAMRMENPDSDLLPVFHPYALIRKAILDGLGAEERQRAVLLAKQLLSLFDPHTPLSLEEIRDLETRFMELLEYRFSPGSQSPPDLRPLKDFVEGFEEHNEDNLKILLHLMIYGKQGQTITNFLEHLVFFKERGLEGFLYKIYFKYAISVNSLLSLFVPLHNTSFLGIAARIPRIDSGEAPNPFDKLLLHWFVFAAKNQFLLMFRDKEELEYYWTQLHNKCLAYFGNLKEADEWLNRLAENLCEENGFAIEALGLSRTFVYGLRTIMDNALSRQTFEEQVLEIKGISFLALDAPYACERNRFDLICPEMHIRSSEMHPVTASYLVSQQELLEAIRAHKQGDAYLKTAAFRYLGKERLRENLSFYRSLYDEVLHTDLTERERFLAEILWAFYTAAYTGTEYESVVTEVDFSKKFRAFVADDLASEEELSKAIHQFCLPLGKIQTQRQSGALTLWTIWREEKIPAFKQANQPIPPIFLRQFVPAKTGFFLLTQSKELTAALPSLLPNPELAAAVLRAWCKGRGFNSGQEWMIRQFVKRCFPEWSMEELLLHVASLENLLELLEPITTRAPESLIFHAFDNFLNQSSEFPDFLALLQITSQALVKQEFDAGAQERITRFIMGLSQDPELVQDFSSNPLLFSYVLDFYLYAENVLPLPMLFRLSQILVPIEPQKARIALRQLFPLILDEAGEAFFARHTALNAAQLEGICQLQLCVQSQALLLRVLTLYFTSSEADLQPLLQLLPEKATEQNQILLYLASSIAEDQPISLLTAISSLQTKTNPQLKQLRLMQKIYAMTAAQLQALLEEPDLDEAMKRFAKEKHQKDLTRYNYEASDIKSKIAAIQAKSPHADESAALPESDQTAIYQDYVELMSYMLSKPLDLAPYKTINDLDFEECKALYQRLRESIGRGENLHQNQVLVVALCCEVLYRTTGKFPRSTQILSVLNLLRDPQPVIHEIKTGEGKSIVSAMHAVLFHSLNKTVDIVTENNELANQVRGNFASLYEYLGIPCGKSVINPKSKYSEYLADGINYSTASNLSLFRARMLILNKRFPNNTMLIADEIDATLTSTVQFRLAFFDNKEFLSPEHQRLLYGFVLEFVQNDELYGNNHCSPEDDVHNLVTYCLLKCQDKAFVDGLLAMPNSLLDSLIESALVAHALEEKVDFYVLEVEVKKQPVYYAAPIISSTKRPDPNVSYSDHVQQLLHVHLSKKGLKRRFDEEPSAHTMMVISAKNFINYYRLQGGLVIGLTGTAGSYVELAEFWQLYALRAYSYPTFFPDRSHDLGLVTSFGEQAHLLAIKNWVLAHIKEHPRQPILLITSSPHYTELVFASLHDLANRKTQRYHGVSFAGRQEEEVIQLAGKNYHLTIANQSLARGADVTPEDVGRGLLVINTCLDLTPAELRQIQGRAARNGMDGQYLSIINAEKIASPLDSNSLVAQAFQLHQHQISLSQQQQREKAYLLEDVRYLIVSKYILDFRLAADTMLQPQFGTGFSVLPHETLQNRLRAFHEACERDYELLLANNGLSDKEAVNQFLLARIRFQNSLLDEVLPGNYMDKVEFLTPRVAIERLDHLSPACRKQSLEQFVYFSSGFNAIWLELGHKAVVENLNVAEESMALLEPYIQGEVSYKKALGEYLDQQGYFEPESIKRVEKLVFETLNSFLKEAKAVPLAGRFVPEATIRSFVQDYTEQVKARIAAKEYDSINMPQFESSGFMQWYQNVKGLGLVSQLMIGGPVNFLFNMYVVPFIGSRFTGYCKTKLQQSSSEVLQMLAGVNDLLANLSQAVNALLALPDQENLTIGKVLDDFGPLLKNKVNLLILRKVMEFSNQPRYLPYLKFLPEMVNLLEPYRDLTIRDFLAQNKALAVMQQLLESEAFEELHWYALLKPYLQCNDAFIQQISQMPRKELFDVIRVLAQPEFFNMMSKMPAGTSMESFCSYLKAPPLELNSCMTEFMDYQRRAESPENLQKQALLALRKGYYLTLPKVKKDLAALKPEPSKHQKNLPKNTQPVAAGGLSSIKTFFKSVSANLVFTAFILISLTVYTTLFFSLPVLAASLAIGALLLYSPVKEYFKKTEKISRLPSPSVEKVVKANPSPDPEPPAPVHYGGLRFFAGRGKKADSQEPGSELGKKY